MMGERRRTSFTVYGKIGKHPKRFPEEKETWFTTKKTINIWYVHVSFLLHEASNQIHKRAPLLLKSP
jgi:hypothetical protein